MDDIAETLMDTWHPAIHEEFLGERLAYYRLTFGPTYHRQQLVSHIRSALAAEGILSYSIYEINGGYDLVLRCWLPPVAKTRRIRDSLNALIQPDRRLIYLDEFEVDETLIHWVWPESGRPPSVSQHLDALGSVRGILDLEPTDAKLRDLFVTTTTSPGTRFFVFLKVEVADEPSVQTNLHRKIEQIVDNATDHLLELSLYRGKNIASYLIKGKLPRDASAQTVSEHLLDPLNDLDGLFAAFARTFTYFTLRDELLAHEENLVQTSESDSLTSQGITSRLSVSQGLLHAGESHTVEVKGSLFADIGALVNGSSLRVKHEDKIFNEGVVRSLVAFLNGSVESDLIVGVIEFGRFEKSALNDVEKFIRDAPIVGDFRVLGVGLDSLPPDRPIHSLGTLYGPTDFDTLQRRIGSTIQKRIQPAPNAYLAVHLESVADRQVPRFHVSPPRRQPPVGSPWFYSAVDDRAKFYVRNLSQTREMIGPEIDQYKESLLIRMAGD